MKKYARGVISAAMAVLMLVMCFAPAYAAGSDSSYVYIGDSMSYNFPERNKLSHSIAATYPMQIAQEMGLTLCEDLAWGGFRSTDLYCLLTDFEGDDYTAHEYPYQLAHKEQYRQKIRDASLITMHLGYSNLSAHLLNTVAGVTGQADITGAAFEADLNKLFTADELSRIRPFADKLGSFLDAALKASGADAVKACAEDMLSERLGEDAAGRILGSLDGVRDALVYEFMSMLVHFDRSIAAIKDLNPSAPLFVLGLFSPLDIVDISFPAADETVTVPVGKLSGILFRMLNLYMRVYSPYSDSYFYVENEKHLEIFAERVAYDPDAAYDILFAALNGDYNGTKHSAETVKSLVPGFMKVMESNTLDLNKLLSELTPEKYAMLSTLGSNDLAALLTEYLQLDENGELICGYFERCIVYAEMYTFLHGALAHPTQAAHDKEAALLLAAIKNPQIDPEAKAFHSLSKSTTLNAMLEGSETLEALLQKTAELIDNGAAADGAFGFLNSGLRSLTTTLLRLVGMVRDFLDKLLFFC